MRKPISDHAYIKAAKRIHEEEGVLEFDDVSSTGMYQTRVSRTNAWDESGAYVMAWVWVDNTEVKKEDEK